MLFLIIVNVFNKDTDALEPILHVSGQDGVANLPIIKLLDTCKCLFFPAKDKNLQNVSLLAVLKVPHGYIKSDSYDVLVFLKIDAYL